MTMRLRRALRIGRRSSFAKDDGGAGTIEFVLAVPMFVVALAFSFEFGQLFLAHQSTVNNVRSAARYLSRTALTGTNVANAREIVRSGRIDGDCNPEYMCAAGTDIQINTDFDAEPGMPRRIRIRTQTSFPLTLFRLIDRDGSETSIPFVVTEDLRYVGM